MDEELQNTNQAEQDIQTVTNTAKNFGQKASATAQKIISKTKNAGKVATNVLANPLMLKIVGIGAGLLLGLVFLVSIIAGLASVFSAIGDFFDFSNGVFSSPFGLTGKNVYGARVIYSDEDVAKQEFYDIHATFTFELLQSVANAEGVEVVDSQTFNLLQQQNSPFVLGVCKTYLNKIVLSQNDLWQEGDIYLCAEQIDHFGLSESECTIALESIAEAIAPYVAVSEPQDVKGLVQNQYQNNFAYMSNVCDKVFVKDHLAPQNEGVKDLQKHNYLAYIFMPKQELVIKETSFAVKPEADKTVQIELVRCMSQQTQTVYEKQTADETWADEDAINKYYSCEDINERANTFTAIDTTNLEYLTSGKSIFALLKDGTYHTYFVTNGDYTAQSIIKNVNTREYLMLKTEADDKFNLVEFLTEV